MDHAGTTAGSLTVDVEGVSRTEWPVRFRTGDDHAFGILTEPLGPPAGIGVVLLNAASDRNRYQPRLARRLAAMGFHVVRFDYRGFGESSGASTGSALKHSVLMLTTREEPFTQDVLGAVEELRRRGVERVALVGRCFGARTALSAVRHLPALVATALISPPLHEGGENPHAGSRWALEEVRGAVRRGAWARVLRGLRNPRRRHGWMRKLRVAAGQMLRRRSADGAGAVEWVSKAVIESLNDLVTRRVPVLFIYGEGTSMYRDFLQFQAGPQHDLFVRAADRLRVAVVEGMPNNLTSIAVQDALIECITGWLQSAVLLPHGGVPDRGDFPTV